LRGDDFAPHGSWQFGGVRPARSRTRSATGGPGGPRRRLGERLRPGGAPPASPGTGTQRDAWVERSAAASAVLCGSPLSDKIGRDLALLSGKA
jgi:hypothetical protein